jgi:predicted DNA-binding protein (MmcQ/YjbR family)
MNTESIREYCLSLPHVTEKIQWGNDLLFCIGGKMFAVMALDAAATAKLSFKCTEADGIFSIDREEKQDEFAFI